ncbi:MAG: hypothetical protein ABSA75_12355 [Candidatus Bathyarchaeia archaeon]
MRPRLYMLKKQNGRTEVTMETEVQVVVVDLDRSKEYPLNFVCVLPQITGSLGKHSNIFSKIFGASSLDVARKLLQRSFRREKDSEIREELTKRLKALKPGLASKVLTTKM